MFDPKFNVTSELNGYIVQAAFFQRHWETFLDKIGDDPDFIYVWCMLVWSYSLFWIIGGLFVFMDITNKPICLHKYKNQTGTHEPLEWNKLKPVIKSALINQLLFGVPVTYILYHTRKSMIISLPVMRQLPSLDVVMRDMLVFIVTWEFGVYYSHRFLHLNFWYKNIHRQHHEWSAPIAYASNYCHPFEFIINQQLPAMVGPALKTSHPVTVAIWMAFFIMDVLVDHSGYHLPILGSSEMHDFHHKYKLCYGNFGWLDTLHGTDKEFRRRKQYQRNKRIFSLKSARELVPDDS